MVWKPANRVSREEYISWTTKQQMDDVCANCGFRYGLHSENVNYVICPPKEEERE